MRRETEAEARDRRDRERVSGVDFNRVLNERLEANTPTLRDLLERGLGPNEAETTTAGETMPPKPCCVCEHQERSLIDGALRTGQSPRSIVRRYADLSRKAIARHRDECLPKNHQTKGLVA